MFRAYVPPDESSAILQSYVAVQYPTTGILLPPTASSAAGGSGGGGEGDLLASVPIGTADLLPVYRYCQSFIAEAEAARRIVGEEGDQMKDEAAPTPTPAIPSPPVAAESAGQSAADITTPKGVPSNCPEAIVAADDDDHGGDEDEYGEDEDGGAEDEYLGGGEGEEEEWVLHKILQRRVDSDKKKAKKGHGDDVASGYAYLCTWEGGYEDEADATWHSADELDAMGYASEIMAFNTAADKAKKMAAAAVAAAAAKTGPFAAAPTPCPGLTRIAARLQTLFGETPSVIADRMARLPIDCFQLQVANRLRGNVGGDDGDAMVMKWCARRYAMMNAHYSRRFHEAWRKLSASHTPMLAFAAVGNKELVPYVYTSGPTLAGCHFGTGTASGHSLPTSIPLTLVPRQPFNFNGFTECSEKTFCVVFMVLVPNALLEGRASAAAAAGSAFLSSSASAAKRKKSSAAPSIPAVEVGIHSSYFTNYRQFASILVSDMQLLYPMWMVEFVGSRDDHLTAGGRNDGSPQQCSIQQLHTDCCSWIDACVAEERALERQALEESARRRALFPPQANGNKLYFEYNKERFEALSEEQKRREKYH